MRARQRKDRVKRFPLYLDVKLFAYLNQLAVEENVSLSALINRILREHQKYGAITAPPSCPTRLLQ